MKYLYSFALGLSCTFLSAQEIELQSFATGFNDPVNIKHAGDSRLFVVEKPGLIQIINEDGTRNTTPFLNITSIVNDNSSEQGLLGLAFHPDYDTNGYFYVNYINSGGNTVISRFSRSTSNPDLADSGSEFLILDYTQPYANHNGGEMAFGADGYLYISSGDGGSGGDPGDRAQSLTTLLGKLLRIDVDNISNGNNYAIPTDNPFFGSTSARQEIWAYGLRNPWKFSFDRSTNDLWIADVGQNVLEEINMVSSSAAGINYGWRCYEGNTTYDLGGNCPNSNTMTFPVAQYSHGGDGLFKCSITGGYRYRGSDYPNLSGIYFFADYCSNEIGMLQQSGSNWTRSFTGSFSGNSWVAFGEDVNGELYIAGIESGIVYKIIDPTMSLDENEAFGFNLFPNPADNQVTVSLSNSISSIKSILIYGLEGKLIKELKEISGHSTTISTENFANGMYFLEITNSEGNSTIKKLIKN